MLRISTTSAAAHPAAFPQLAGTLWKPDGEAQIPPPSAPLLDQARRIRRSASPLRQHPSLSQRAVAEPPPSPALSPMDLTRQSHSPHGFSPAGPRLPHPGLD